MERHFVQDPHIIRSHLWNALEPGDAYDITKSLIAKMPGDKRPFMGDNLEMVVLFQAAEIQRLIDYLDEYKIKYKELDRRQLDRHSYQVQIKELIERCSDSEGLRIQVNKLKEYIRKLKDEMQENKNVQQDENLKNKYNNALQQLDYVQKENKDLNSKVSSLSLDIQHWKNRCEASEKSKERQIDQLKSSIETQRRTQFDKEQRQQQQIRKFSLERNQLQIQVKRLRQEINIRNTQVSQFRTRLSESTRQAQYGREGLQSRCHQLQSRIRTYTSQIDELKYSFRTITNEKNQILQKYRNYQDQLHKRDYQINEYRGLVQSNEQIISQLNHRLLQLETKTSELFQLQSIKQTYQNKIVMLSQQIQRLNAYSQSKTNQAQNMSSRYSRLQYQVQTLKHQNSNLVSRITQRQSSAKMMGQLQQSILQLTNQNRRLNDQVVFEKTNKYDINKMRQQNHQLHIKIQRLQTQIINTRQDRKSNQIQIERFTRRQQTHVRRINELEEEYRKLQSIKGTVDPNFKFQITQYKNQLFGQTDQNARIKRSYEQQLTLLNQQNANMKMQLDNLRRRLNSTAGNKHESLQKDIGILNDQIRQWAIKQRDWIVEKEQLIRIIEDNQRRSKIPVESDQRFRQYEERIRSLTTQIQVLRQQDGYGSGDMVRFQIRIREQDQQMRKLKQKLRIKSQEIAGLQAGNQELIYLRGQTQQLLVAKQILQGNLIKVTSEINMNNNQLVDEHQRLKLRYQQILSKVNLYEQRTNTSARQTQTLANQNANLNNTVQMLINQINQHRLKDRQLGSEIDKTRIIKQQNQSYIQVINEMNQRVRYLSQQNNSYRAKINQFPKLMEVQVRNHNSLYQQRLINAQQKYLVQQQRLHATQLQSQELRRRVNETSLLNQKIMMYQRKIFQYQQKINHMVVEIEQVRRQDKMDRSQNHKSIVELNEYRAKYPQIINDNNNLRKQILEITQRVQIQTTNRTHNQNQIKILVEENNRFKLGGQQKIVEYQSQINFLKQEIDRLRRSQSQLAAHFNESNLKTLELTHEIERLSVFMRQSKNSEISMQNLTQQIERLNNVLRLKVNQTVEWHNKYISLETQTVAIRQQFETTQNQILAYKQRIQQYDQKFNNLNGEFQKLSVIIYQLKNQNKILKQENFNLQNHKESEDKNKVLSAEIERLTALKNELEQQILEIRMRFVDQNALEKRIKQQLSLLVILFAEIESLRKRVKDKEKEVQQVRRSSLVPFMS